nr:hypothetical protein [Acetobacter pomorum]
MSAQDAASYVSAYTDAENSFQKGTPQFVQAMQERISAAKALTVAQQNTQMIGRPIRTMIRLLSCKLKHL